MCQCLLIAHARALNDFSEGVKDLTGNPDGLEEVRLPGRVDHLLAWIVPVEVHHGLLQTEQVVDGADDQVDGGRVAGLGTQIVLPICLIIEKCNSINCILRYISLKNDILLWTFPNFR